MAKLHTINIPTKTGIETASGFVALLFVGRSQYKFLLQKTTTSEVILTHFASGYRLGSLTPIKLHYFRSYYKMKDRAAAEIFICELVNKYGAEPIMKKLDNAPVIN